MTTDDVVEDAGIQSGTLGRAKAHASHSIQRLRPHCITHNSLSVTLLTENVQGSQAGDVAALLAQGVLASQCEFCFMTAAHR